mmetsp:Transcript_3640/g.12931  ORF Transcript_3640/g.12931 Transcript_3640/m.12931 type:complete len:83 (-) Transcript_3640:773-1021(-)
MVNPARRSRIRRVSCAWTRLRSMDRNDWNERVMASLVISWKTARFTGTYNKLSSDKRRFSVFIGRKDDFLCFALDPLQLFDH